ncbi:MAG: insulinase family protein [Candidatus Omnitrophica bacterium]|nr:insulinase family protein [Candidatus Omnitrophota bacterium]
MKTSIEISNLKNGLRVVAVPMRERKSVSVGIWVGVGGRDEEPRLSGISHFLEHMVFKGTAARTADQIKQEVEGVGGSLNAFTSEEYTCFLAKSASRHFEGVFDVLADMVRNASLKDEDIKKERTVIMEEIKMTQDQPSQLVGELLAEIVWPGHPLGRPLAGTLETVGRLSREDLTGYKNRFYEPGLITVVAAGDVDRKKLIQMTQKRFGGDAKRNGKKWDLFKKRQKGPDIKLFHKSTEQTHLELALHALPKAHPDEYALDILSVILGGNMSSRLFNEVREERGLAYDIGSSVRKFRETGAFIVSAGVDNHKLNEALRVIMKELEKIASKPVEADELKRAKEFYLGQMELGLESAMNQMLWAGETLVCLGRCLTPEEVIRKAGRVTAEDLRRVARGLFRDQALNLAVVGPVKPGSEKDFSRILSFSGH